MTGVRSEVRVHDEKVQAMFAQAKDFDARPTFDEIGAYLMSDLQSRFLKSIAPDGTRWEASQRATAEGGKTLIDRGHLRDSFTYNVFTDGSGLEFGSNDIRAAIHQFGGQAGRNHATTIVPRPMIGIADEQDDEIMAIFEHDLAAHLRKAAS